jgi:type I restriction enzyme S subunit
MSDDATSEWQEYTIGDYAQVVAGNSPDSASYNENGEGLPFFQGSAEFGFRHPIEDRWCSSPTKIAQPDDVLLSMRAPVGETNIASKESCIGRGLSALRPKDGVAEFLYHLLGYYQPYLESIGVGGTFDAITKGDLNALQVAIPPRAEQERIASVLYTVDQMIDTTQQLISSHSQARRAVLSDPEAIIQGDYEMVPLVEVVNKKSEQVSSDEQGECPHIGLEHLSREGRGAEWEPATEVNSSKYEVVPGDILFGQIRSYLQKVCIADVEGVCSTDIFVIEPDGINRDYLHAVLSSWPVIKWSIRASVGTKMPRVQWDQFVKVEVPVPSESEQESIGGIIQNLDARKNALTERKVQLEDIKHGLMQDLLSGDVRTPDSLQVCDAVAEA